MSDKSRPKRGKGKKYFGNSQLFSVTLNNDSTKTMQIIATEGVVIFPRKSESAIGGGVLSDIGEYEGYWGFGRVWEYLGGRFVYTDAFLATTLATAENLKFFIKFFFTFFAVFPRYIGRKNTFRTGF